MAEEAATEVPGVVRHAPGGVAGVVRRDLPAASVHLSDTRATLSVAVAASWPIPVSVLARNVRDRVAVRVRELTGITATRVDVDVDQLIDDRTEPMRGGVA